MFAERHLVTGPKGGAIVVRIEREGAVLIATGGMTMAFRDTGTRVSRTRHAIRTTPPKIGPTRKSGLRTDSYRAYNS
jgi:hypothetical protein